MWQLRTFKFCLLALITALLCFAASPSFANSPPLHPLMQLTQNTKTRAEQLEQQRGSHYSTGQFTEAVAAFKQAAQAYAAQGNSLQQAIALSNLCLTYQQLGQWAEATQAIT
jgi:tetratricopeptide (TPR) repeat protein